MAENKIVKARSQFVATSNALIRTRYTRLTLQQQRLVLYIISKIRPTDTVETEYKISLREFCEVCGTPVNGRYFDSIRKDLEKLMRREFGAFPDGHMRSISWIGDCDAFPVSSDGGTITYTLNKNLAEYLFQLSANYTQFELRRALVYSHVNTIRLWELLRSYVNYRTWDRMRKPETEVSFEIEELRRMLTEEGQYKEYKDFKKYVIDPAVKEINELSDEMKVSYETVTKGRKVVMVIFLLRPPTGIERMYANDKIRKEFRFKD